MVSRAHRRELDARLIVFGVLGLLSGAGVFWVASNPVARQAEIPSPPVILLVGWSFIGSGLLSWRARPDNWLGPVMVLTGFAWFARVLAEGNGSVLFTVGQAFQVLYLAGFLYLIMSFPTGRLQTSLDRTLIIVTLGLVTVVQLAWMLFDDTRATCDLCSANLLEVARNDALSNALLQFQRIAGVVVIAVATGLLAVRLVRASRPQRRAVVPVLLAGIVAITVFAVFIVADAVGAPHKDIYGRIAGYTLAIVPVAVLVAFLQRQLARGAVAGLVVELGEPRAAVGLTEALSRALGDPSLSVGYWFPGESRYVDGDGKPIELPQPGGGRMSTVVERGGQPVAVLIHDPALQDNAELVESVCAAAGPGARPAGVAGAPGRGHRGGTPTDRARPARRDAAAAGVDCHVSRAAGAEDADGRVAGQAHRPRGTRVADRRARRAEGADPGHPSHDPHRTGAADRA